MPSAMRLTKKLEFMLFSLGYFYEQANLRFKNKPLKIVISKRSFIDLIKRSEIVSKGERAIYRNLENLENKGYISYKNRVLRLTRKGKQKYINMKKIILPYLNLVNTLSGKDMLRYIKKSQTVFQ